MRYTLACGSAALLLGMRLAAQIGGDGSDGPFEPTQNTILDTAHNGGLYQFTRIRIRAGIQVQLQGPNPAVLRSQGEVLIEGSLLADGETPPWDGLFNPGRGGPGGYGGGAGSYHPSGGGNLWIGYVGQGPGGGGPMFTVYAEMGSGGSGGHATRGLPGDHASRAYGGAIYGSALPFDLRGGSGGGGGVYTQGPTGGYSCGAGGGGAFAILTDGALTVAGLVAARGGDSANTPTVSIFGGCGSGGAILLRALGGVRVAASGSVLASGGWRRFFYNPFLQAGGEGWLRIDSYEVPADLQGTVQPAPLLLRMPAIHETSPARPGHVWRGALVAAPGDQCFAALALAIADIPFPPLGRILIDPAGALVLGPYAVPTAGLDPLEEVQVPIPDEPALLGLRFYVQVINALTATGRPRLSDRLGVTVVP